MKKILLITLVFIFTNIPANAAQVFYNIAGQPSYVSYGGGTYTRSLNNFGSNAAFTPENRIDAGERMRARRFAKTYAQSLAERNRMRGGYPPVITNTPKPIQISRFDKNYKISSGKSYTRNGVKYFD